ncbi:MAG: ligase-associated DNA damage response endonuclease PdeM [Alphaproteobacteria bacterium]|nr:ligase-associated DNA damage response endonuclease PdeM [Alphaproteobacteria bacterium]MCB9930093.1 ligase-associated DNA damage response endonuclease PdeM [Alphaproteobacteria bacterium]
MTERNFTLNGARLVADPTGALWWPDRRLLAVADLHLEKASAYAAGGVLLPPYDSRETLDRLARVVARRQPVHVVALGDSFHDALAAERLEPTVAARLRTLVAACADWIWIAGNHDPEPPAGFGGRVAAEWRLGPLVFRHEPQPGHPGEVAGHLHPKVRIVTRARALSARCFVTDGHQAVLPAFGALTGGLDIRDRAIHGLFRCPPVALALGPGRVYAVAGRSGTARRDLRP